MESNIVKLQATLSDSRIDKVDRLIEILNNNIMPTEQLTSQDVHIRCMYIVSEEINSYGGKFPLEELYKIKEKIIDSPVLIGHKKDQLPIGRNFHSEVVFKNNSHWVKSYFYWLKSADNGDDLQKNIDGGVIKECSIGFTFLTPECSVCKSDIRTCRHEPFGSYSIDSIKQTCYFYYKDVDKVLETSMVYRGAIPNTSISNELLVPNKAIYSQEIKEIVSLEQINNQTSYLIMPRYEGIDVVLTSNQNSIDIEPIEQIIMPKQIIRRFFREFPKNLTNHFGQLIGYRGKERCSKDELLQFLNGGKSKVKRVELRLLPTNELLKLNYQNIKAMRYKVSQRDEIDKVAHSIMTREGVRIFSTHELPQLSLGQFYQPIIENEKDRSLHISQFVMTNYQGNNMVLSLYTEKDEKHFLVRNFLRQSFKSGKKFIAEKINHFNKIPTACTKQSSGKLNLLSQMNNSMRLELDGAVIDKITIQSILLHQEEKFLFYKSN